ncbi:acyltransferase family protein [Collinsella aerofaciens]|uniref:Fucose 4-O-acetylase and related acetyltransferases n=1 Tax=Collinsella aerofaciens TaxID=74426 RepID=A0A173W5E9_9ACTN|nr:acyltransferase family protein [Collinsella aerofaciens]CUN34186.1 Fucose 4-O-acetylase and related acetyltransferases [Collinsella aerofaciens]
MGSKRLDWIDIAKGIAIILVIVGHTVPNPSPLRHAIFSFHMPVFFILAGYTFRPKPWCELLSGSVSRLLVPYVVLALAWQVPTFLMSGAPLTSGALVAGLKTLVFASGVDVPGLGVAAVGMAWFLAALFASRLLFNALMLLFDARELGVVYQGVACTVIAFCGLSVSRFMGV